MTRFRIIFVNRAWKPWELHEWHVPQRWWQNGKWNCILSCDTKGDAELHMKQIVEGENMIAPSYYTDAGSPVCDF